ncbi:MAG: aminofutalosine synthase MqnE [Ignavibacteriales bacterium]|nr:aminofutalosine synthase MqnE [Ignavibacteriales bacterium]
MAQTIHFRDTNLLPIWEKVQQGERLNLEDGLTLFGTTDVISLGKMAHAVQRERSGDAVYFVLNQKIEPTNVCVLACKFCDFATKKGRPQAYEMTVHDILSKLTPEIHEVHITGGLHPDWEWEYYLDMLRQIKKHFPNVDIKAFTAVEIDFFHKKFKLSIEEVLRQLKEAGLRTMPGGGAEVFSERVRKRLFSSKIGAKAWLDIHRAAHRLGIPTNSTILYGHIETQEERVEHLIRLRTLQDETRGFLTFIPLAFQPGATGIKPTNRFTSAIDDLKMIAVSRLMLDNFPHIKAYWVMLTEEVASVALNFGADDLDGTVGGEKIAHDAGAIAPMQLTKEKIIRIIRDAGKIPVERDVYYNPLNLYATDVVGKIPYLNSVPFYHHFEKRQFKMLPVTPRRMGVLARNNQLDAGLFSLCDYFSQKEGLTVLPYCIATRDQVKSVMLFSNHGWRELQGKIVGIVDDTATSVRLLQVLLEKKYGVKAELRRMHTGVNSYDEFDAVLLIGDEAMRHQKTGLQSFELVYDLAAEWYDWQKLPFVFAVWAVRNALGTEKREELSSLIQTALKNGELDLERISAAHAKRIGWSSHEATEYLEGFNYHLGEREREAIDLFEGLLASLEGEADRTTDGSKLRQN